MKLWLKTSSVYLKEITLLKVSSGIFGNISENVPVKQRSLAHPRVPYDKYLEEKIIILAHCVHPILWHSRLLNFTLITANCGFCCWDMTHRDCHVGTMVQWWQELRKRHVAKNTTSSPLITDKLSGNRFINKMSHILVNSVSGTSTILTRNQRFWVKFFHKKSVNPDISCILQQKLKTSCSFYHHGLFKRNRRPSD